MKLLHIMVLDENGKPATITKDEFSNIYEQYEVTDAGFQNAVDTIVTKLMQDGVSSYEVDLNVRNEALGPAIDMTIEEIEAQLGYRINIIHE